MAITVCGNCIDFGSQSICIDPAGIYVSGRFDFAGCNRNPSGAQGSTFGFLAGGGSSTPSVLCLQKFPFSSDTNASDAGEISPSLCAHTSAGQSSFTHGYTTGGFAPAPADANDRIQKYPFASSTSISCVGNMPYTTRRANGAESYENGYTIGGQCGGSFARISKFSFANEATNNITGNLSAGCRASTAPTSSKEEAFITGGSYGNFPAGFDGVESFPFASDTPTTCVGNISGPGRSGAGGTSDQDAGNAYIHGGEYPGDSTCIAKFAFSSSVSGGGIGNLIPSPGTDTNISAQSSLTHGYATGGRSQCNIQKYPFSSDTNASCVGDLLSLPSGDFRNGAAAQN